jgi:hypothetical protein
MTQRFVIAMTISQAAAHARLDEMHRDAALRRLADAHRPRPSKRRASTPAKRRWPVIHNTQTEEVTK